MEISSGSTGSTELANAIWTGPRTWPALTSVVITAPKVRTSKKFLHIQAVSSRALASSFGSLLASDSIPSAA
jgi:hypothetical protein